MRTFLYSRFPFLIAAFFMIWLAGCNRDRQPPRMPASEVGVITVKTTNVALESELSGRTAAHLVSEVRPQVSGIIKERRFEEGADVRAGQILYVIDPSTYQTALDQAEADLAHAQALVTVSKLRDERYAALMEMQGVSKQDADDTHATYLQALASVAQKKASLESARINLDYTQVKAPISGRIGKSTVTAGSLVTANQEDALATIRVLDPMYVDLTQSSTQLLKLRKLPGTEGIRSRRVRLKLEDGSQYSEVGSLKFQEVAVDPATGSVILRAQFPNPDGVLLPGMYVQAVLDEAVESDALLVPQQSISYDLQGNAIAMVVNKNNRVEQRTVVTARAIGNEWLITSGLDVGDQLIVEGLSKVRPNDIVRPVTLEIGTAVKISNAASPPVARDGGA